MKTLAALSLFLALPVLAANAPLDDKASDPRTLGWMQGFPPAPDKLIMQPDSDFFSFPKMRWSVCHMRELMPTKQISRGLGASVPFEYALSSMQDSKIDQLRFLPLGSDKPMTWQASLAANYTDGLVVLHKGKVVYEYYSGCLTELGQHAAMSMTKSLTGLAAEILIAEDKLNDKTLVRDIIPELKDSAFGDASVRQVMDMTTALKYSEDYANPKADIWQYAAAASPLPKPANYLGPNGYFEYLTTIKKQGQHGQVFGYRTVNTDVLGWIISRMTGQDYAQFISERLWQNMGAEQDAYVSVDAKGTSYAGGGLNAGLRDMARIGLLMLNNGTINGHRLFPKEVVSHIRQGGDKQVFAKAGYKTLPGGSYHSMWWHYHNEHGAYAARGVHGQTLYIDPKAEMVIARFASHPVAGNAANDPTSLPAFAALGEYLLNK